MPSRHGLVSVNESVCDYLVVEHYSKIAGRYDEFYSAHYSSLADTAIRLLKLQADDRVVDVGGGTGGVAEIIRTRAGTEGSPVTNEKITCAYN